MSLVAELTVPGENGPFARTFEALPRAACTFDDIHYLDDDRGYTYYVVFLWLTGADPDAFVDAIDADPTIRYQRRLTTVDDRTLFRVETTAFPPDKPLIYPECRKHDVTLIEARRDGAGLHLHARFPSRSELDGLLESVGGMVDWIDVTRLYTEESSGVDGADLTRKQREAVTLAYDRGYFETPSEVTLDALANDLDITPQTLSRHLRVAVEKLVGDAVGPEHAAPGSVLKDTSE